MTPGGSENEGKEARTGVEAMRRRPPWPPAADAHLLLPAVSPFRPRPVGPYYPLMGAHARETSRMAMPQRVSADFVTHQRPTPSVPIGARYALSRAETVECVRIGLERNANNRAQRRANRRCAMYRTDEDISVQGVLGEYAFARLFDLAIDIHDTECRSALTESRFDAVLTPERWTVDVKTATNASASLLVTWWKANNPPDVYALLVYVNYDAARPLSDARAIAPAVFEFRGFASSAKVFADESRIDTVDANGDRDIIYAVAQANLVDREALVAEARTNGGLRYRPAP